MGSCIASLLASQMNSDRGKSPCFRLQSLVKAAISLDLGLVFSSRTCGMASALAPSHLNSESGRLFKIVSSWLPCPSENIVRLHSVRLA